MAGIYRPESSELLRLRPGVTASVRLSAEATGGVLSVTELVESPDTPPAAPHVHRAEDEMFYVLSGQLDVLVGEEQARVGPGCAVVVPRDTVHGYTPVGYDEIRLLVLLTPPGFEGFWREVRDLVAAGGPPDRDAVASLAAARSMFFVDAGRGQSHG